MIIHFGLDFDSMLPDPPETRLGFVVAGPALFLSILETQLGVMPATASEGARIVQYRACLKAADSPQRFYHRSFTVDELGVARALLHWRDTWYLAGWEGVFTGPVGKRLNDMVDVEAVARETVRPSFGQRLAVVLKALETRRTQIEALELIDDREDYPPLWQRVIERFRTIPLRVDDAGPCGKTGSDLALLQHALVSADSETAESQARIELSGDGSVLVLKAGSRAVSARLLADYLKKEPKRQTAVLSGSHGYELDEALESVDFPKCGFQPVSKWRPPLQILPLALGLLWQPLDPGILSQFLNLPMAPLPKRVRAKLATVVVKCPGIGGPVWQETVESLLASESRDRGAEKDKVEKLAKAIDYWLAPERFDPDTGAATAKVGQRCQRVAEYLAARVGTAKDDSAQALFASAHRQATDLAEAVDELRNQGTTHISRQQLERLLAFIAGSGSPLAGRLPEVGHVLAAEAPAVFVTPRDEVIWWDLSMPDLPSPYPWTRAEIGTLNAQGVHLAAVDHELQRQARTWLRPIRFAQRRLVLVLHRGDENHHPVWDRISTACQGWVEKDIESFVRKGKRVPGLQVKTARVAAGSLPLLRRWWQLPDGRLLSGRDRESYSSLDDFIKSPYKWVLRRRGTRVSNSVKFAANFITSYGQRSEMIYMPRDQRLQLNRPSHQPVTDPVTDPVDCSLSVAKREERSESCNICREDDRRERAPACGQDHQTVR